jgi:hypothetical protein
MRESVRAHTKVVIEMTLDEAEQLVNALAVVPMTREHLHIIAEVTSAVQAVLEEVRA